MAQYRNIQISFWTDPKVIDDFTPEDKFFYLYLMTNPHTSLCGCYEISTKQMADETGYSKETVDKLIDRMMFVHDVIRYSKDTKEMMILNWHKYNWTSSDRVRDGISAGIEHVKNPVFRQYLQALYEGHMNVCIGYAEGMPTSFTFMFTDKDSLYEEDRGMGEEETKDEYKDSIIEIVDYMNKVCGTRYMAKTQTTSENIRARLKEGYTIGDCKYVIDVKAAEWKDNPKMRQYLRPITLFAPSKFAGYLNQQMPENTDDDFLKGFV